MLMIIKHLREILMGSPPAGTLNTGEVQKFRDFRPTTRYIWKMIQDSTIVTIRTLIGTHIGSIKWCYFQWL